MVALAAVDVRTTKNYYQLVVFVLGAEVADHHQLGVLLSATVVAAVEVRTTNVLVAAVDQQVLVSLPSF